MARHGDFGQTCVIPRNLSESNCLNVVIVKPNPDLLSPNFLKYLFNNESMRKAFNANAEGSTQKVISTTEISKTFLAVPKIGEQINIVKNLDTIDRVIISKKTKLSQTQSLKKSLMQDLLTGKKRVQVN